MKRSIGFGLLVGPAIALGVLAGTSQAANAAVPAKSDPLLDISNIAANVGILNSGDQAANASTNVDGFPVTAGFGGFGHPFGFGGFGAYGCYPVASCY